MADIDVILKQANTKQENMNFAAFLLPLLEELVGTVGPTVLNEVNTLVGNLAQKHNVPLTVTPAHTVTQ